MKKKVQQKNSVSSLLAVFLVGCVVFVIFSHQATNREAFVSIASADRGETEYENEGGDDNHSSSTSTTTSSDSSSSSTTSTKSTPTYKTVYVTKVITTLDPKFTTDTDKDGIVDGLDPHPTIPESDFFTDDDNDGIPNAFDKHPGEDDYAYFEQDNDANGNGILDSYEFLGSN